ncbi:MAG: hypothetical protein JXR37_19550 [Kiritimatiellae bacterium]|nr:hypothetical protein [Kiritimatiellia bacterium]
MRRAILFAGVCLHAAHRAVLAGATAGIPIEPGSALSVKKVPVTDCRVLTAFVGTPVDGTLHSLDYSGRQAEYPRRGVGAGINFKYNGNDGLHITLGDNEGVDAVVLRGGAATEMAADATDLTGGGRRICTFEKGGPATVCLDARVKARKVSFFKTTGGSIADVAFYRIDRNGPARRPAALWVPKAGTVALPRPKENSYVKVPDAESLRITGAVTIAAWIRIADPGRDRYAAIVSQKPNRKSRAGYALEYQPGANKLVLRSSGDSAYAEQVDLDTGWHHVAGVVDGTTGRLYVDGEEKTTDPEMGALEKSDAPLSIGRLSGDDALFEGVIDEVCVYARALSADEVRHLAARTNGELTGTGRPSTLAQGLRGYWNFDEADGASAKDRSGNGNDGALRGGAAWTNAGRKGAALECVLREAAPDNIDRAMRERYRGDEHRVEAIAPANGNGGVPLRLAAGQMVHLVGPPRESETGLTDLALEAEITGPQGPFALTLVVQDPLNPRLDLCWLPFAARGPGRYRLAVDIPDQVLLKDSRLWLTLGSDADLQLAGPGGGAPAFLLTFADRAKALPEALAWRKLVLKTLFAPMSEPRPWGNYKRNTSRQEFFDSQYGRHCPELFMTIDQCHALDPTDDIARQYREWVYVRHITDFVEVPRPPEPPAGVPAWAWYPRMAWLEFRRMAEWWMDNRMVPTGEIGVGVQDDTDFYQQFADMPFFETDGVAAKVVDGCRRLAELADKENLDEGLNKKVTDALHAYEEGVNHLALMARWFYGDPIYWERCLASARSMERATIVTEDGRRHIPDHQRIGAVDVREPRKPAQDAHSSPLMWHAALQAADYNRSPRILKPIREWADTWLRYQKPGQWATGVDVRTGKVTQFEKDRPLSGGYRSQACVFTWLHALTGDSRYIEPFLHYYRQGKAPYPANSFLPDACSLGALDALEPATLAKLADQEPAAALLIRGDPTPLTKRMIGGQRNWHASIDTIMDARRFPDMYTTTEQYTDRVFLGELQTHPARAYLSGMCKRNKFNPTHAVSWEGFGTDYAALVLKNRRDGLKTLLYNFADAPLTGKMRIWALEHGVYRLTVGPDADGDQSMDEPARQETLEITRADRVSLSLPPKTVTVVEFRQEKKLDPVYTRPDLAIAAREVTIDGNTLKGTVHNIGSADVADAVVGIVDARNNMLTSQSLGSLAAPSDLMPKRKEFRIALPAAPGNGWRLVLDPANRVPEIYEGNNEVALQALPATDYAKSWE